MVSFSRKVRGVLAAVLAVGCASSAGALRARRSESDAGALSRAAEEYYSARTDRELTQALERAQRTGPASALYHELAANQARLENREPDRFWHLISALLDSDDDAALLHLDMLQDLFWTYDNHEQLDPVLSELSARHPEPAVRARAAWELAASRHLRGLPLEDGALAQVGWRLPLAFIGAWDNDQGKGFELPLPPETEIDLKAHYPAALVDVAWRTDPPISFPGWFDLREMFTPGRWSVAYAAAAFESPEAGSFELRFSSTDPIKVWVNGRLVFTASNAGGFHFDQFVVPISLVRGVNRVLLKSAHRDEEWKLGARLTRLGGAPATGMTPLNPGTGIARNDEPTKPPLTPDDLVAEGLFGQTVGAARRAYLRTEVASRLAGRTLSVQIADHYLQQVPSSLVATYQLALATWNNGERGRATDLLAPLGKDFGDHLPQLRISQARLWRQQGMKKKARDLLLGVTRTNPHCAAAWRELADLFEDEGWTEDTCRARDELIKRFPGTPFYESERAKCQKALKANTRARTAFEEILREIPNDQGALWRLHEILQDQDDLPGAEAIARRLVQAHPGQTWAWIRLGETLRRLGDRAGAENALRRALANNPDSAEAFGALARIAYQAGDPELAVARWQAALARNPDDEKLSNRLAFLAPAVRGRWASDVPDEAELERLVADRREVSPRPGANVIYLLDHEVTSLKADGSTLNVVTLVAHALNQAGRDELTRMSLGSSGKSRVLHAYAVDPAGRQTEASSIRGSEVRFRGLQVGSTVVLQFQNDAPPLGYLARHLARTWWFQGPSDQRLKSQWVLWAPAGTQIHESAPAGVVRTEETSQSEKRYSWTLENVPPLLPEPEMPPRFEVAKNLSVSTVPGWASYLSWEDALVFDQVRSSPELDSLADRLFKGAPDPLEKLLRLQAYLMEEIRYERDYENHIAGVKPHAAPVVAERGYGDCKDKVVLFMTLARRAQISTRYALIRTRDAGAVLRDLPMQQFNHVIVFVPEQRGIPQALYFDPTADALDLGTLRDDDVGTESLVYDLTSKAWEWRRVPFQPPGLNAHGYRATLALAADGSAAGSLRVNAQGVVGSFLRRQARNAEDLARTFQHVGALAFPGAKLEETAPVEVKDLRRSAEITSKIRVPAAARREGSELRFRAPFPASPKASFALAERRFPLVLGVPGIARWDTEITLPAGFRPTRVPSNATVSAPCLLFERKVTSQADRILVEQSLTKLCERIPVADYALHRKEAESMERLLGEEFVLAQVPAGVRR